MEPGTDLLDDSDLSCLSLGDGTPKQNNAEGKDNFAGGSQPTGMVRPDVVSSLAMTECSFSELALDADAVYQRPDGAAKQDGWNLQVEDERGKPSGTHTSGKPNQSSWRPNIGKLLGNNKAPADAQASSEVTATEVSEFQAADRSGQSGWDLDFKDAEKRPKPMVGIGGIGLSGRDTEVSAFEALPESP